MQEVLNKESDGLNQARIYDGKTSEDHIESIVLKPFATFTRHCFRCREKIKNCSNEKASKIVKLSCETLVETMQPVDLEQFEFENQDEFLEATLEDQNSQTSNTRNKERPLLFQ